ncbi:WD40/YVTN/BNR-like repeat-containing protein [Brevibacillus fortis]|uniref:Exo-alpha-sialidase n=1 Tax=Brevibacillus fortis TaxID=2126352 RepID=A0A2P7VDP8_9BACL|nr:hypothetical protein [Brevibacillus fortis]PSJ97300.1 hypothetical protein C7R93_09265 [Brevibacillus fortis]
MNKLVNLATKKRVGMALCSVGALMLATATAFAASTPQIGTEITAQVKTEDGVNLYSTDSGKTWNKTTPASTDQAIKVTSFKDGVATVEAAGDLSDADSSKSITVKDVMVKTEDGVNLYSTDNGKTWNEFTPTSTDQAFKVTSFKDGIATIEAVENADLHNADNSMDIMVKIENGVTLYSTDGGKSWNDKAPNKN